ncbi:MAG: hypothetical protein AAFP24_05850, partial [Pseudomonadota bacterium]
ETKAIYLAGETDFIDLLSAPRIVREYFRRAVFFARFQLLGCGRCGAGRYNEQHGGEGNTVGQHDSS